MLSVGLLYNSFRRPYAGNIGHFSGIEFHLGKCTWQSSLKCLEQTESEEAGLEIV